MTTLSFYVNNKSSGAKFGDASVTQKKGTGGAPTLIDVARLAGVSVITASRAIRNKGPMSVATRARVMRAVAETGYTPNPIAASLVSSASKLIGVIVPSLANMVFVNVLSGINSAVLPEGYATIFAVTEYDPHEEMRLVESMLAWRPAALVLTGVEHVPETVSRIRSSGVRCIELMDLTDDPIDIVIGFSHWKAGYQSAQFLLQKGYRRLGYVGHDLQRDRRSAKRYEGFVQGLRDGGTGLAAREIGSEPSSVRSGRLSMMRLVVDAPGLDAVYFSNDDMAIGGIFHAYGAGISIPQDIAVMGFNDLDIGQELPRRLTTIRTHRTRIGYEAGIAALALASGSTVEKVHDVGFDLVEGETA